MCADALVEKFGRPEVRGTGKWSLANTGLLERIPVFLVVSFTGHGTFGTKGLEQ